MWCAHSFASPLLSLICPVDCGSIWARLLQPLWLQAHVISTNITAWVGHITISWLCKVKDSLIGFLQTTCSDVIASLPFACSHPFFLLPSTGTVPPQHHSPSVTVSLPASCNRPMHAKGFIMSFRFSLKVASWQISLATSSVGDWWQLYFPTQLDVLSQGALREAKGSQSVTCEGYIHKNDIQLALWEKTWNVVTWSNVRKTLSVESNNESLDPRLVSRQYSNTLVVQFETGCSGIW